MSVSFAAPVEVIVLDIEGTICPISFVKATLFPYFLEKLPLELSALTYPLKSTSSSPVEEICSQFPENVRDSYDSLLEYITSLVNNDIKDPILKSLQGFIWKLGYENGELMAPVYQDAIEFIKDLSKTKNIYIYSSGSIKAQILLFGHVKGANGSSVDMNSYLSGYYDITTAGFKQESSSYVSILKDIGYESKQSSVLFLSDNVKEVDAAIQAGMNSLVVDRPGNAPLSEADKKSFSIIETFRDLKV
ncbi:unnamed protein product [Debaryomyces tyrocola]|nr:unnamed protein product [Debaryomyces tyrocola]